MSTTRAFWLIPFRHIVPTALERWFEQRAAERLVSEGPKHTRSSLISQRAVPSTWARGKDASPEFHVELLDFVRNVDEARKMASEPTGDRA